MFKLILNEHLGSAGVPQSGLHGVVALQVSAPTRHLEHWFALQCTLGGGRAPGAFINDPGRYEMAATEPQRCIVAFLLRLYRPGMLPGHDVGRISEEVAAAIYALRRRGMQHHRRAMAKRGGYGRAAVSYD